MVEDNAPLCVPIVATLQSLPNTADPTAKVQIWLSFNGAIPSEMCRRFTCDSNIQYIPFCDDFGPLNMSSMIKFIDLVEAEAEGCRENAVPILLYCVESGRRSFTNAVFLLGSYMLLKLDQAPDDIWSKFCRFDDEFFEGYRDATFSSGDFRLTLLDCWRGLQKGKALGWVSRPVAPNEPFWGMIDRDAYDHYDDPLNADLHEVVPNKFVAFCGPRDLGGQEYSNNYELYFREFSPEYYFPIFKAMNVTTVIRLNEVHYNRDVFISQGIDHVDLYFEDCTCPPPDVVTRFFRVVDEAKGLVAIHCKAGLGRTGTLIALYMMREYGFTARESTAWLRIMRPGCVLGSQQNFLCHVEASSEIPTLQPLSELSGLAKIDEGSRISLEKAAARSCGQIVSKASADTSADGACHAFSVEYGRQQDDHAELAQQMSEAMIRRCSIRSGLQRE